MYSASFVVYTQQVNLLSGVEELKRSKHRDTYTNEHFGGADKNGVYNK